jgi:hypothetical protein
MHNNHDSTGEEHKPIDESMGYESSDVRVSGVVVFLTALGIFVAVAGLLAYGIGKVINAHMAKDDGAPTKWTQSVDVRSLGNLPSSPELQNKIGEMAQHYPAPRIQADDGNQDIADLHAREELLLNHYTLVDGSQSKVRIPIERAIGLIAQRGLPVAPAVAQAPRMTGDKVSEIIEPLTNGFVRTGYEQDMSAAQARESHK